MRSENRLKPKPVKRCSVLIPADGGLIRIMMQSAGEWYFDAQGNPKIVNNEALREAFKVYKKLMDSGIVKQTSGWNEWLPVSTMVIRPR